MTNNNTKENASDVVRKIELSEKEKQRRLSNYFNNRNEDFIEIPFCCTTTVAREFMVNEESQPCISFVSCLYCKRFHGRATGKCDNGIECGEIDVCIIKLLGGIQFIAATPVGVEKPGESFVCCNGSICVNKCVGCVSEYDPYMEPGICPCPEEDEVIPVELDYSSLKVCVEPCQQCNSGYTTSQNITFSGKFLVCKYYCDGM